MILSQKAATPGDRLDFVYRSVISAVMFPTAAVFSTVSIMVIMMMFTVMIALNVWIKLEVAGCKGGCRTVCISGNAAEQFDPGRCQSRLCTAADTSADQCVCVQCGQNTGQRAVSATVRIYNLGGNDAAIADLVYLKLLRMSKMLENLSVFVSNCYSHVIDSFQLVNHAVICLFVTGSKTAAGLAAVAEFVIATGDSEFTAVYDSCGQFFSRLGVDCLNGRSRHLHLFTALFLRKALTIDEPNGFILLKGEYNHRLVIGQL